LLKYDQPDFYKFNQDSIELVHFTLKYLVDKPISSVIDIGCGCGVMGIEYGLKTISSIDLLELQPEFIPFIEKNIRKFNIGNYNIIEADFLEYKVKNKYDLILMNPPYYTLENSRKSHNNNKNTCRLIAKEDIKTYIDRAYKFMNKQGYLAICFAVSNSDWQEAIDQLNLMTLKAQTIGRVNYLILKNIESL
jgi:tRNA1(Val) A37 N6-methylase TrmN6